MICAVCLRPASGTVRAQTRLLTGQRWARFYDQPRCARHGGRALPSDATPEAVHTGWHCSKRRGSGGPCVMCGLPSSQWDARRDCSRVMPPSAWREALALILWVLSFRV